MQNAIKNYEDVDSYKTIMFLYQSAIKEVGTKLEILNDEFHHIHKYNPIEHIKTRVKTPESIVKKLRRYGHEISIENMVKYVNDIAGIRVICSFTSDIYRLAGMVGNQSDLKVLTIKDYIKNLSMHTSNAARDSMLSTPMPLTVLDLTGNIVWHNEVFGAMTGGNQYEKHISTVVPGIEILKILENCGFEILGTYDDYS